ncbi:MAG: hypothetical protein ACLUJG_15500 [Lawsonibacter sp.]
MELFFQTCAPAASIGVTGQRRQDHHHHHPCGVLEGGGIRNVYVGGNIGKPLLPDVAGMEPEDFAVLELSSFQLMTMEQSPHIAVVTNLSPPTTWTTTTSIEEYVRGQGEHLPPPGAGGPADPQL